MFNNQGLTIGILSIFRQFIAIVCRNKGLFIEELLPIYWNKNNLTNNCEYNVIVVKILVH